jgi:hypothetical protein
MPARRVVTAGLAIAVLLASASASAAPESEAERPVERGRGWYGWKILAVDLGVLAAGSAILYGSGGDAEPAGKVLVIGGLLLSGPVVHGAHGRWDLSGRSLVSRALLPVLGGGAGLLIADQLSDPEQEGWDVLYGAFLGFTAGLVTAEIIDVASGWEHIRVAPVVTRTPGGATAGLVLSF